MLARRRINLVEREADPRQTLSVLRPASISACCVLCASMTKTISPTTGANAAASLLDMGGVSMIINRSSNSVSTFRAAPHFPPRQQLRLFCAPGWSGDPRGGRGAEYPVTGLTNANRMLQVASCVANAGRLDSGNSYKFNSRVWPQQSPALRAIDAERVALAAAPGASVPSPADWRYGQAAPPGRNGFSFSSILRLWETRLNVSKPILMMVISGGSGCVLLQA